MLAGIGEGLTGVKDSGAERLAVEIFEIRRD